MTFRWILCHGVRVRVFGDSSVRFANWIKVSVVFAAFTYAKRIKWYLKKRHTASEVSIESWKKRTYLKTTWFYSFVQDKSLGTLQKRIIKGNNDFWEVLKITTLKCILFCGGGLRGSMGNYIFLSHQRHFNGPDEDNPILSLIYFTAGKFFGGKLTNCSKM